MKSKLLYITCVLFVLMTACSTDEKESFNDDKFKVTELVDAFVTKVRPSKSYTKFIDDVQTKSANGLTQEELMRLEQLLVNQQSDEIIELYNYVLSLNLPQTELEEIIEEYIHSNFESIQQETKNRTDECAAAESNGEDSPLFSLIMSVICKVQESSRED